MKQFILGLILGVAAGAGISCVALFQYSALPPALPSNSYGRFVGTLNPTRPPDGRRMKLNEDFIFIDPNDKAWVAPIGSIIDGASIPQSLWSIAGGPFEGKYRNASVVHDVAREAKKEPSDEVHKMFYFACRCAGVDDGQATAMYYAVLKGGPKWTIAYETSDRDGEPPIARPINVEAGKPLTATQLKGALEYFENNKTDLQDVAKVHIDEQGQAMRLDRT